MENLYDAIEKHTSHWDRRDENTLVLYFSGYRTKAAYDCETEIRTFGAFVIGMDFDRQCGKTKVIVREPKKAA